MSIKVEVSEMKYVDAAKNSDKFYRVFIWNGVTAADAGSVTQYGRNGTAGKFTPRKRGSNARRDALKKLTEKITEGYVISREFTKDFGAIPSDNDLNNLVSNAKTGTVRQAPTRKISAKPMLAETIESDDELEDLFEDDTWVCSPKLDGERLLIEIIDGEVAFINRSGQPKVKNIPQSLYDSLEYFSQGRWVFDGEIVGQTLYLFDMPAGPLHTEDDPFEKRYAQLVAWISPPSSGRTSFSRENIEIVPIYEGEYEKREFFNDSRDSNKEGVIFRHKVSKYYAGKRSQSLLKFKFVKNVDLIVQSFVDGKDSVNLAVYNESGKRQVVGKASIIGKGEIEIDDVVVVRFLYTVDADNPKMVQPRIMNKRDDKTPDECLLSQFKGVVTDKNVLVAVTKEYIT